MMLQCHVNWNTKTEIRYKGIFGILLYFIGPVLNYGCEIWGWTHVELTERVHRKLEIESVVECERKHK